MATYYVRQTGDDTAAGTSAAAAWRTVGKALGASGISSGDTVYIGPGVYREAVTANLTNPTGWTYIIGDPLGEFTGDDPGEVVITSHTTGPYTASTGYALNTNARDYLDVSNILFHRVASVPNPPVFVNTGQHYRFTQCAFIGGTTNAYGVWHYTAFNEDQDTIYNRCVFWVPQSFAAVRVSLTESGSGSDYDANVAFTNCLIFGGSGVGLMVDGHTGAGTIFGGGIDVDGCTLIASNALRVDDAYTSSTYPVTIKNSLLLGNLSSAAAGKITDSGGNIVSGTYTNTTQHATSRASSTLENVMGTGLEYALWGLPARLPFEPGSGNLVIGREA